MPTTPDVKSLALHCVEAAGNKDYATVKELLAPDVSFTGPSGTTQSADAYIGALKRMAPVWQRSDVKAAFADGNRACVLYDFVTRTAAGAVPCVEVLTFEGEQIKDVQLVFDRVAFAPAAEALAPRASMLVALGARVHVFLHPERREQFTRLFRDVLECTVQELEFGLPHPILWVPLPDGSGFSIELTELAPDPGPESAHNDEQAFRGAWIEFRTPDLEGCLQRLDEAAVPSFRHPGSIHRYFSAPGGQVFRIIDIDYQGP
ncbi:MAG: hypothetical protein NVSMB19_07700 [Vulcanimicrobiaceae bacterium]